MTVSLSSIDLIIRSAKDCTFPKLVFNILRGPRRPSSILKFGKDSGLV